MLSRKLLPRFASAPPHGAALPSLTAKTDCKKHAQLCGAFVFDFFTLEKELHR